MKPTVLALALLAASSSLFSQERPVPKDSTRLSISGCARGRVFTVGRDPEHESSSFVVELGMKFRLEGDKKVLADIKAHEASMVEITGLMKQSDVRPARHWSRRRAHPDHAGDAERPHLGAAIRDRRRPSLTWNRIVC